MFHVKQEKMFVKQVEIQIKYRGYIERQHEDVEKSIKLEESILPANIIIILLMV
jgi:tRNA U34 5-carboxymethylaminomethyl modifying enzyme MnmG/GidA